MTRQYLFLFLLVLTGRLFAQDLPEKLIQGRIVADSAVLGGVHVVNLISEKAVYTNTSGVFSIMASEDDLLVFSAEHLEYARKSISKKDYENGFFEIKMYVKPIELNEVVIENYSHINAKDLGIIDYTPKSYTPAERRLRTATNLDLTVDAGMMAGGSISLDPLINWLSGRTAMLKKEVDIEKRERLQQALDLHFDAEYYIKSLHIPEIYVNGFRYYVVEDSELEKALNSGKSDAVKFRLSALATDFLEFHKEYEENLQKDK